MKTQDETLEQSHSEKHDGSGLSRAESAAGWSGRPTEVVQKLKDLSRVVQQIAERVNSMQRMAQRFGRVSGSNYLSLLTHQEALRQGLRALEQELDQATDSTIHQKHPAPRRDRTNVPLPRMCLLCKKRFAP